MHLRRTGARPVLVATLVKVGLELQGAISTEARLDQSARLPIGIALTDQSQTGSNPIGRSQIAQNPTEDPLSGQVRTGADQIVSPQTARPRIAPRAAQAVQARNQARNLVAVAAHKRVADLAVRSLAMEAPRRPVAVNATQLRHNFIDSNG